ncbi:neuronal membrane glycoprotein M6-a-like [Convolutriloba macropyga]|uniref:neuronal membrane glycoprotein M6-a-like n=1 Tax=Convolutriloba macropyga TaxID=536237 RepID=UPI003F52494D
MGVCERIPFGSMISTVLVAVGCALFAGGTILGLKASEDFMEDYRQNATTFDKNTDRVDDVKDIASYSCYGLCAVMVVVCIVLLLRGFFSTTRDDVWGGSSFMSHTDTGRCLNIVLIVMTFIVFIAWTGILAFSTIPLITCFYMIRVTDEFPASRNLDMTYYLIVPFDFVEERREILGTQLEAAHDDLIENVLMYYIIAWGGAFLSVWGLAGFLITLAGTWGIGQESKKQEEYIYRRNREQRELEDYQRAQNGKYHM